MKPTEFLKKIASQRRLLHSIGKSMKPVSDNDIRRVENAATFQCPEKWMKENRDVVYLVCPKNYYEKMKLIYEKL